jgi:YtcA family
MNARGHRRWVIRACALAPMLLAGCQQAPSFNILGSFFPAWLLCLTLGILLAAGTRFLLSAVHLQEALSPPIVMYPCLAALFTFGLWLLVFR